ncbi:MAG: hypothetical protein J6Y16_11930 [Treponema sp.]|nr:hypothetical protein [Treponema sp.]
MDDAKKKRIAVSAAFFLALCAACFLAGWLVSLISRSEINPGGTGEYEAGSAVAEDIAGSIADGLQSVAGEMHGVGEQIADGLTDVGELGAIGARIEQGSRESSDSAARIEAAIQRIDSILDEAEKKNSLLDHDDSGTGSGGGG